MKLNNIYRTFIAVLFCLSVSSVFGQQIYNGQINITQAEAKQQADSVLINMQLDLSSLKIDNQRMLTLTPLLVNADNSVELTPIIVSGSGRNKAYTRAAALDKKHASDYQHNVVSGKETRMPLNYSQTVAYEDWMSNASLSVKEDLCGCGGHSQQVNQEMILSRITLETPPQREPIKVLVSVSKVKTEKKMVVIHFPLNMAVIKEGYMGNEAQLEQINTVLNDIKSNKNINITAIEIEGYASPEGPSERNEQLSRERGQALKQYLSKNLDLPMNKYQVTYGGENWTDLISLVEASSIDHKEEILSIIKNTKDVNERKTKLAALDGGRPYQQMLTQFYPQLRNAVCHIHIHYSITSQE